MENSDFSQFYLPLSQIGILFLIAF